MTDPDDPAAVPYWSADADALLRALGAAAGGLSSEEAGRRASASRDGRRARHAPGAAVLLLAQFRSPIILILLASAALSAYLGDHADAAIILGIVGVSGLLGFWQEWGARDAVARLLDLVRVRAAVLRDGAAVEVPAEEVVPGDVVLLNAGDLIPGDGRLLEARDLFVNEATLTGETFPVEKAPGVAPADATPRARGNSLFLGTSVVSGTARLLVARVGRETEFGRVSRALARRPPETEFERGIARFGALLVEVTLLLVLVIFAVNVLLDRPALEALLFSLAIAVGLTPQLLPAVVSVNLARGARRMARDRVIVRRLAAVEDLGAMTVLCTDKTGTLTEGAVRLVAVVDFEGRPSATARLHAYLNATFQSGFANPIDRAIAAEPVDAAGFEKLDEEPYDFVRKRLSVLAARDGRRTIVTKGALTAVLEVCDDAEDADGNRAGPEAFVPKVHALFADYSARGCRVLAVARRDAGDRDGISKSDEAGMTLLGLLVFDDPLRPGIAATLGRLRALGVAAKVVTGDNRLVAVEVARRAGIPSPEAVLLGEDLRRMTAEALARRAVETSVFAEVEPNQKERIILALKAAGHAVGYLGDGINDAPALHAADVGVSVADAADVAREAAQVVLLEKDLDALERGVREGRRTFANTMKYIFMATSANFGNMFSMAGGSAFLPFLPLLPKQVLLTNLLTDLPEMTIAADRVDPEMVDRPRRWDIGFVRRFMVVFGLISSVFDFLTFGAMWWAAGSSPPAFRTGWFLESVTSAALIVLVVRSRRGLLRSRPAPSLTAATFLVISATLALPYTRLAVPLGFAPLSPGLLALIAPIVAAYVATAEAAKAAFYRAEDRRAAEAQGRGR